MAAIAGAAAGAAATKAAIAGAAVSGGFNVASGLFKPSIKRQWKYQQRFMELQQKYALEQMDHQYEIWKKQFQDENDYNDPSKIMARFRAAGISPASALGQSGASIGATLTPSGTAGMTGTGGSPGLDYSNPFAGTPAAMAEGAMIASNIRRTDAAANRDNADADYLRGETHTVDYRKRRDDLDLKAGDLSNQNAEQIRNINTARAIIMDNDAQLSTITFGYKLESVMAELQILKDHADILRAQKSALARQAEASYLATLATAFMYSESGKSEVTRRYLMSKQANLADQQAQLTEQQVIDFKNQIELDWNREFEIPVFDKKGNVVETHKMNLREMYGYVTANEAAASSYLPLQNFYDMRNSRHKLLYGILLNLSALGFGAAGAYATKGKSLPSQQIGSETTTEYYGPDGDFRGGSRRSDRKIYRE